MTKEEAFKWALLFSAYANGYKIIKVGLNAPDFEELAVVDGGDCSACEDDYKIDTAFHDKLKEIPHVDQSKPPFMCKCVQIN